MLVFVFYELKLTVAQLQCSYSELELACLMLTCSTLDVTTTPYIQKTTNQLYGMQGIANKVGRVRLSIKEKAYAHLLLLSHCFNGTRLGPPS
jgi:hypothetical protein